MWYISLVLYTATCFGYPDQPSSAILRTHKQKYRIRLSLITLFDLIFQFSRSYFYDPYRSKDRSRDSSVGIATPYWLDVPRIESRLGRVFPHPSGPVLGPIRPPVHWVPGLLRVKRPERGVEHPTHLAPKLRKE